MPQVSPLVPISVPLVKVLLQRLSREYNLIQYLYLTELTVAAERLKHDEAKKKSTRTSFKTLTTNMVSLREPHTRQTMRRRIRYMRWWTRTWTHGDGLAGSCYTSSPHPLKLTGLLDLFREARENEELAKHRAERPKIQQQFADLKRGLAQVTDEEWEGIPEVGNLMRKKRKGTRGRSLYPTASLSETGLGPSLRRRWMLASKQCVQFLQCSFNVVY